MKVFTNHLTSTLEPLELPEIPDFDPNLVLIHGDPFSLEDETFLTNIKRAFPNACIAGCSSSGELMNGQYFENSVVYAAIEFEYTAVRQIRVDLPEGSGNEYEAGKNLASRLSGDDLKMIILYSEGLSVDCDDLMKGIREVLGPGAPVFGGLAADNLAFEYTVVIDRNGTSDSAVVAVGLYGDGLNVSYSNSFTDQEGIEIEITGVDGNIITEINGSPALDIYDKIVSEQGGDTSMSISFPVIVLDPNTREALYCRSIHEGIEGNKSILAAGSVPIGPAKIVNMMNYTNFLDDAKRTSKKLADTPSKFAMIISCAGRRGSMGNEWTLEFPEITKNLGDTPSLGFYAYGEIGKNHHNDSTILHNETINIATLYEI